MRTIDRVREASPQHAALRVRGQPSHRQQPSESHKPQRQVRAVRHRQQFIPRRDQCQRAQAVQLRQPQPLEQRYLNLFVEALHIDHVLLHLLRARQLPQVGLRQRGRPHRLDSFRDALQHPTPCHRLLNRAVALPHRVVPRQRVERAIPDAHLRIIRQPDEHRVHHVRRHADLPQRVREPHAHPDAAVPRDVREQLAGLRALELLERAQPPDRVVHLVVVRELRRVHERGVPPVADLARLADPQHRLLAEPLREPGRRPHPDQPAQQQLRVRLREGRQRRRQRHARRELVKDRHAPQVRQPPQRDD